jgi:hypothetical protein
MMLNVFCKHFALTVDYGHELQDISCLKYHLCSLFSSIDTQIFLFLVVVEWSNDT